MVHRIKNDKRSQRTRKWLLESLLELIKEKDYDNISVTELTEKADIARQTFYRNYESIDDILLSKMDEIFDEYYIKVSAYLEVKKDKSWDFEVDQLICVWQYNDTLFKALLKAGLAQQTLEKLSEFFTLFHMKAQNLNKLDDYHKCLVYNLAGGVYMILYKWFENEKRIPKEIIADIFKNAADHIHNCAKDYESG